MVTWHTQSFRELAAPVADVLGARTAKDLEKLRIHTVGDLLRHLPRRYLSGTELTDLATLEAGDHVAVMAKVSSTKIVNGGRNRPSRLEVSLTDGRGYLAVTFFGREHLGHWWGFAAGWCFVIGKTASCAAMASASRACATSRQLWPATSDARS